MFTFLEASLGLLPLVTTFRSLMQDSSHKLQGYLSETRTNMNAMKDGLRTLCAAIDSKPRIFKSRLQNLEAASKAVPPTVQQSPAGTPASALVPTNRGRAGQTQAQAQAQVRIQAQPQARTQAQTGLQRSAQAREALVQALADECIGSNMLSMLSKSETVAHEDAAAAHQISTSIVVGSRENAGTAPGKTAVTDTSAVANARVGTMMDELNSIFERNALDAQFENDLLALDGQEPLDSDEVRFLSMFVCTSLCVCVCECMCMLACVYLVLMYGCLHVYV
jgi:hypothetical protein